MSVRDRLVMSDRFFWWRWAFAVLALLWIIGGAWTAWGTTSWLEFLGVLELYLLAGLFVYGITGLFSRLLYTVFVSPVLWVLETRGGSQHGTARWAKWREVRRAWLTKRGSIYLAIYRDIWGSRHPLTRSGGEHVLLLGPSRSGKGIGCVIPFCLVCNGYLLAKGEKNEIFETTSAWRASQGQKIVRFAPAENGSDAFNPLDVIPDGEGDIGTALSIATTLVEGEGQAHGDAAHWQVGASELIAACSIFCRAQQPGAFETRLWRSRYTRSRLATKNSSACASKSGRAPSAAPASSSRRSSIGRDEGEKKCRTGRHFLSWDCHEVNPRVFKNSQRSLSRSLTRPCTSPKCRRPSTSLSNTSAEDRSVATRR